MAHTLLEETRQSHEDIERLERLIVKELKRDSKTHKERLLQNHAVRQMLETIQSRSSKLVGYLPALFKVFSSRSPMRAPGLQLRVYDDEDGSRKEELASLREGNVFSSFYSRMKDIKEYYRRVPTIDLTGPNDTDEALQPMKYEPPFSGDEGFGRFLDLHELYAMWRNSNFGNLDTDYYTYVSQLKDHLQMVSRADKLTVSYKSYVNSLLEYLKSFYDRSQPLSQLEKVLKRTEEEFYDQWDAGQVAGWENKGVPNPIGLETFDSVEELENLGVEKLKEALSALGLKCGGTVRQRAERLLAVKGKQLDEIDKSFFAKGVVPSNVDPKSVALIETLTGKLCDMLGKVIADTRGQIEKRQAQTYEELLAEQEEGGEDFVLADSDEDEDDYIYNPLKLPLGWDGKPIPYWLYKLHGLNIEYKCEICGNATYFGRRAFEKHFKEYQHLQGMKALGIPNTKEFFEVTTIEDARSLWQNLQTRERGGFRPDDDEEFEDERGNVYNRKTYMDLKRQGLI